MLDNDVPGYKNLSVDGDSGAPWISGTCAFGSHVGEPGGHSFDAFYMAADDLEWGLQVYIMTSP